jgi:hypothetical protein
LDESFYEKENATNLGNALEDGPTRHYEIELSELKGTWKMVLGRRKEKRNRIA